MASNSEITAGIVQEVLKARGVAISGLDSVSSQNDLVRSILSDEAVIELYNKVYKAVSE